VPILSEILADARRLLTIEGAEAATEIKILAAVDALLEGQAAQTAILNKILAWQEPADTTPASARVLGPTYRNLLTGAPVTMPQNVFNDIVTVFGVEFDNLAGQKVDPPAGGTVAVKLVNSATDPTPSTLGNVALEPNGVDFAVTPNLPAGSSAGAATVVYDDLINGGTPNDISFAYDIFFGNDPTAASAHVDPTKITTRPLPAAPPPGP
jgi:hypothetical protein